MKKLFALVLALVMVMSLAATGFAGEVTDSTTPTKNDSITVTGAVKDETYKLYKMFDLSVNDEYKPSTYVYTIDEAWETFFTTGAGKGLITVDDQGHVTGIVDEVALAKAAATAAKEMTALESIKAEGVSVVFADLENGYYLITSTLGTNAMTQTTPDESAVTINEKNLTDTIEKFVQEDSNEAWGKENDAQVGDTVNFKSNATLNPNTTNVSIVDTMDEGLTYNNDVEITNLSKTTTVTDSEGNESTITNYTITNNATGFEIVFTQEYLDTLTAPVTLNLTYSAVLNEKAVVTDEDGNIVYQNNETIIKYGDKQSVTSQTKTTTHKSTVHKHANGSTEPLAGAVFSLKKDGVVVPLIKLDDTNYRVAKTGETGTTDTFVTVATGDIVIWGLDNDKYTLEEITAPAGYNKLTKDADVVIDGTANVENKSGTELPSTGGMGTTLFYVVGGFMVLAAVVLLVTKKRMAVEG